MRLGMVSRIGRAAVPLLLSMALGGAAAPQQASETYGALVENNSGGYIGTMSADQASEAAAKQAAIAKCGKPSCELVLTFIGRGCAAFVSAGPDGAYGLAVSDTLEKAQSTAFAECESELQGSEVCSNQVSACNMKGTAPIRILWALTDDDA